MGQTCSGLKLILGRLQCCQSGCVGRGQHRSSSGAVGFPSTLHHRVVCGVQASTHWSRGESLVLCRAGKDAAKLDRETEETHHERVPSELKKKIMQVGCRWRQATGIRSSAAMRCRHLRPVTGEAWPQGKVTHSVRSWTAARRCERPAGLTPGACRQPGCAVLSEGAPGSAVAISQPHRGALWRRHKCI